MPRRKQWVAFTASLHLLRHSWYFWQLPCALLFVIGTHLFSVFCCKDVQICLVKTLLPFPFFAASHLCIIFFLSGKTQWSMCPAAMRSGGLTCPLGSKLNLRGEQRAEHFQQTENNDICSATDGNRVQFCVLATVDGDSSPSVLSCSSMSLC